MQYWQRVTPNPQLGKQGAQLRSLCSLGINPRLETEIRLILYDRFEVEADEIRELARDTITTAFA
jgi:hypothetical protein